MDKTTERETRDFMSVESFSQLPFIRSVPPLAKDKGTSTGAGAGAGASAGAIRLFGKDFGSGKTNMDDDQSNSHEEVETNKDSSDGTETSSRKFECHYCCRNFPTSQALGGHQNAHKRERQQAKRAHLQSTMLHGSLPDPHVYSLINYARLPSAPPLPPYHSWTASASNAYSAATSRIYGSFTAHQQPINGSPLAYWRVPAAAHTSAAARDRPAPPPPLMFGPKDEFKPLASSASQFRFGYESKPEMHEHVSLDLHL